MSVSALALAGAAVAGAAAKGGMDYGGSFLNDWLGDNNRRDQGNTDFYNYTRKSDWDWNYYRNLYAPYEQQLQKDMFDYTSARNYDLSIRSIGDSLAAQKAALSANGYNPILAVNGGASPHAGAVTGSLGAVSSPHSAAGVSTHGGDGSLPRAPFSLQDVLSVLTTAKSLDKMDADIKNVQARTAQTLAETEKPGVVGQAERSLESITKQIGEHANSAWSEAMEFFKNWINPVKPADYNPHVGPEWEYNKKLRRSIYAPNID